MIMISTQMVQSVETPEHCDNNEFDYLDGELDVDCGDVCGRSRVILILNVKTGRFRGSKILGSLKPI